MSWKIWAALAIVVAVGLGLWKFHSATWTACTNAEQVKELTDKVAQLEADKNQMAAYTQSLLKKQTDNAVQSRIRKEVIRNVKAQDGPASDYLHEYFTRMQRSSER